MRTIHVKNAQSIRYVARACAVCALALTAGCASDEDGGGSMQMVPPSARGEDDVGTETKGAEQMAADGRGPDGRIVAACQGLSLEGMRYSPGGDTLPNKCAPFNLSTNNPYAIRCIDAMPDLKTPFPGDEYCILPPAPEQGFQLGVHPGGRVGYWEKMWAGDYSFYRDPALTGPFELKPGDEAVQNYHTMVEAPADKRYFYRRQFRGRIGSHHGTIYFTVLPLTEEGWQNSTEVELGGNEVMMVQNAHTDYPPGSLEIPPEEVGLGILVSTTGATINLHHFNSTDSPILRENWINIWYIPADKVTRTARLVYGNADINYPPGMVLDNQGSFKARSDTQILSLWGHHHAWTTRLHAWIKRAGGEEQLIYDSYNWYDMPTFAFNSLVENPAPGVEGNDGASSGPIVLHAGDAINFNCHVETTREHAQALGRGMPMTTLEWGNQAYDAEMCVLLGQQSTVVQPPGSGGK